MYYEQEMINEKHGFACFRSVTANACAKICINEWTNLFEISHDT